LCFFLQAEDGIRDLVRSRGLGDVYKRQSGQRGRTVTPLFLTSQVRILLSPQGYFQVKIDTVFT